jgi:hypothetical protein
LMQSLLIAASTRVAPCLRTRRRARNPHARLGGKQPRGRARDDMNRRRRGYIERLLRGAEIAPALAATRTQVIYWTYLGAAFNGSKVTGERLERIVAELKRIALGGSLAELAVIEDSHRRKRRGADDTSRQSIPTCCLLAGAEQAYDHRHFGFQGRLDQAHGSPPYI